MKNIYKGVKIIWHSPFEILSSYFLAITQSEDCPTAPTAVARTFIGGGGGCLFIYSCSAGLVSFEIKFKFINLKRNKSSRT